MPVRRPVGRAPRALPTALGPLLFGVAYVALQRLMFGFRFPSQGVNAFWSPGALLLTALLVAPRKEWGRYGVALGLAVIAAYAGDRVYGLSRSLPCAPVYWVAAAASAEAIRRYGGVPV